MRAPALPRCCLVIAAAAALAAITSHVRSAPLPDEMTLEQSPAEPGMPDRVAEARAHCADALRQRFAAAGIAYPPADIFLRAFKREAVLELWARPAAGGGAAVFRLVATYPILGASGALGPKRREGDRQVPEGFYVINRFNPRSLFHLSLGLDYPNASDLALTTNPSAPGSDIFLHGGAKSIGCLAMGDAVVEELFLAALDARDLAGQAAIAVHIFPCRLDAAGWRDVLGPLAAARPELADFWRGLQAGHDFFEREKMPPEVAVRADGSYHLDSTPTPPALAGDLP